VISPSSSLNSREAKPISAALGPSFSPPRTRFTASPLPVWFITNLKLPAIGENASNVAFTVFSTEVEPPVVIVIPELSFSNTGYFFASSAHGVAFDKSTSPPFF